MGKAIIIPDLDFRACNLGEVTLVDDAPLQALSILMPDAITGVDVQMIVGYIPASTSQSNVAWSLGEENDYVTLSSGGLLRIRDDAHDVPVVVRVDSLDNPTISAQKTIMVTSSNYIPLPDGLVIYDKLIGDPSGDAWITFDGIDGAEVLSEYTEGMDFEYVVSPKRGNGYIVGMCMKKGNTEWGSYRQGFYRRSTGGTCGPTYSGTYAGDVFTYNEGNKYWFHGHTGESGVAYVEWKNLTQDSQYQKKEGIRYHTNCQLGIFYYANKDIRYPDTITRDAGNADTGVFYYAKWTDHEGNPIIHLVPCTLDGEPGLYDLVNGKFFGNLGTGTLSVENE